MQSSSTRRAAAAAVAAAAAAGTVLSGCDGGGPAARQADDRSATPSVDPRIAPRAVPSVDPGQGAAGLPAGGEAGASTRGGEGRWRERARLELVREHRGGAVRSGETPGEPVLTRVRDLDTDGARILVLDGSDMRVAVLDSSGGPVRYLGRPGPGPGELRTPERVEPAGEGVAVFERRPATVQRWGPEGAFLGRGPTLELEADGAGGRLPATTVADWGPRLPEGRAVRLVRLDHSDPSASRSAIHVADADGRPGPALHAWRSPGNPSRLPEVFGARRSWTAGAAPGGEGRLFVARGDRYEVRVLDADGDSLYALRRDVEPRAVDATLRERAVESFAREARRAGAPPSVARRLAERAPVAESLPAIGELWHSPGDGRLWVGIPSPGPSGGPVLAVRAYDVYDHRGGFLGRVASPPGFQLFRVRGRMLYGTWRDSLDVPGVRVYRLVVPGPAP